MRTKEEIRLLAGHPDAVQTVYIDWFERGYLAAINDKIQFSGSEPEGKEAVELWEEVELIVRHAGVPIDVLQSKFNISRKVE